MTRRTAIIEQVGTYFASKGKTMTLEEYKNAEDVPIRFQLIKRSVGSWSRLLNMVGDISRFTAETPATETPKVETPTTKSETPTPKAKS